jgi:hypothetical protein
LAEDFGRGIAKEFFPGEVDVKEAVFFEVGNGDGVRKGLEGLANESELAPAFLRGN